MRYVCTFLLAAVLGMISCQLLYAGDWEGLVISHPGPGAETANADANVVAQGLMATGTPQTTLLRDATEAELDAALTTLYGRPNVLIYIAAPYQNGAIVLADTSFELNKIIQRLARGGTAHIGILYENCAPTQENPTQIVLPDISDKVSVLFAQSAVPGTTCPKSGARLADALVTETNGKTLQARIGMDRIAANSNFPDIPMIPTPNTNMSPDIPIIADDIVSLSPAVKMVHLNASAADTLMPVSYPASASPLPGKDVAVFPVSHEDQIIATPLIGGQPRPFLILGTITEENADAFGPIEQTIDLENVDFSYADLDARRAFRQADPEMFAQLVAGGMLDPPPDQLTRALQTELRRMGCYGSSIDGLWGPGSQAAMGLYFDQTQIDRIVATTPTARLFRSILLNDDVTCTTPAPIAVRRQPRTNPAPTKRSRTQNKTTRRQTTQRASEPARQTQKIKPAANLGVFR